MKKGLMRMGMLLMTAAMAVVFVFGICSFVTAPAQAKAAQEEVERILREKQAKQKKRTAERAGKMADNSETKQAVALMQEQLKADQPINLHEQYTDASQLHITGIGDSVMLAASDALYQMFPNSVFDAEFGRPIDEGEKILEQKEAAGELGDCVFLSLITNTSLNVTEEKVENLIAHCDGRPVFFTTTYGIDPTSNTVMENVVSRHRNVYIIDWGSLASQHPEWILSDGLHPNAEGSQAYAQLVHDEIQKDIIDWKWFICGLPAQA